MEITPLMLAEAYSRYPLYFRQALRFIIEIGGTEALDRFEKLMAEPLRYPVPAASAEHEAARQWVTEQVADDLHNVRKNPDLI